MKTHTIKIETRIALSEILGALELITTDCDTITVSSEQAVKRGRGKAKNSDKRHPQLSYARRKDKSGNAYLVIDVDASIKKNDIDINRLLGKETRRGTWHYALKKAYNRQIADNDSFDMNGSKSDLKAVIGKPLIITDEREKRLAVENIDNDKILDRLHKERELGLYP